MSTENKATSPDKHAEELEQVEESLERIQRSSSRLPLLLFAATFLGSILGLAADLSDASGLIVPVLNIVSPVEDLRLVGSSTILEDGVGLAAAWKAEFEGQNREQVDVVVDRVERTINFAIDSIGTVNGCQEAAQGGNIHMLAASEPLSAIPECESDLAAAGISIECAATVGYDVIVFVTDINNVLPPVTRREMVSILTGSITDWSAITSIEESPPIRILARRGSGTTDTVLQNYTGSTDFPSHFVECDSNQHCLNTVLSTPGALYWVSAAWLRTQPPKYLRLVLVPRGGTQIPDPLADNFNPDFYPTDLMRPLYLFVLNNPNLNQDSVQLARNFLDFTRGIRGQQILEDHFFYTYFDPPTGVETDLPGRFGTSDTNGLPIICQ